jgi:hypothetical protein
VKPLTTCPAGPGHGLLIEGGHEAFDEPETETTFRRRLDMTKLRTAIAAGIILATTALSTVPAAAYGCYYEYYWDAWGNYVYAYVCY